jgi:IS5 family transposase
MTGDQAFRALVIKQLNGFSYEQLAFHLADSQTYRRFCGIGFTDTIPKKSALAENLKRIESGTLEAIARGVVSIATDLGIEKGRKVRVDSTVVESNIHDPSDSLLLWDCVPKGAAFTFVDLCGRLSRIEWSRPRMGGVPCHDTLVCFSAEPSTTSTAASRGESTSSTMSTRRWSLSRRFKRSVISMAGRFWPGA